MPLQARRDAGFTSQVMVQLLQLRNLFLFLFFKLINNSSSVSKENHEVNLSGYLILAWIFLLFYFNLHFLLGLSFD